MKNLLIVQFDLHHRLFNNVLNGFSDQQTNERLEGHPRVNHIKYLAGHLLNSQWVLAKTAGMNVEIKWNELFAVMGQSHARDNYPYPTIEEIKNEWNALYSPLRKTLEEMGPDQLAAKPIEPFDQVAESLGEMWAFVNHHIAYHIGQIGILRRAFNKDPMSYG